MEVRLDRLLRKTEPGRDLGVGPAGHDRGDDLALAIGRSARGTTHLRQVGCRIHRASAGNGSNRGDDRVDLDALVEIAGGAALDGGSNDRMVTVAGDQQDGGSWFDLARNLEHPKPGGFLELDVAQEHVGSAQQFDGILESPSRSGKGQVRIGVDGGRDRRENRRVVINDPDPDRSIHRSPA